MVGAPDKIQATQFKLNFQQSNKYFAISISQYCMGHTHIKKLCIIYLKLSLNWVTYIYIYFLLNQAALPSSHTCKIGGLDSMASKAGTPLDEADCGSRHT